MPLPPGGERRLYKCRLILSLTTFADPRRKSYHRGWGCPEAFAALAEQWFGSPQTALYREPIRAAAEAALDAGKRRDVAGMNESFAVLSSFLEKSKAAQARRGAVGGRN